MNLKKIAVAVAAAASAFAAQAAGTINIGGVPHNVIYLSGASAPDNFLAPIAESLLTDVRHYRVGSDHRAYTGAANGIQGITDGTRILFIKRSIGGSAYGVDPVARAQRIATINVNNVTGGSGTAANPYVATVIGANPGDTGYELSTNVGLVPDFGVSDVEPALFQGPLNTENDRPALDASEQSRLSVSPVNQLIFGLVATETVPTTVHFSRSVYGALLNGQITDWEQVDPSLSGPVVVVRRSPGSGTQATYNQYFGNFPSESAIVPARAWDSYGWKEGGSGTTADPYIINPASGFTVLELGSSGNVRAALTAANNGTDYQYTAWDSEDQASRVFKVTFSESGPVKAVGILSFDSYAQTSGFNFRNLDGAGSITYNSGTQSFVASPGATGISPVLPVAVTDPTLKSNVINGKYDFVVELSVQSRNVAVTNDHGDTVPAIGGIEKAFADEFVKRAGDPAYNTPAIVSLPQYYAGHPQAASQVSKYTRNANTRLPLQYRGN